MIAKKYKIGFVVVFALCVVFMALGAKFDFQITQTLYNPKSVFGIIFEALCAAPMYLFIPVFGACMIVRNKNEMSTLAIGVAIMLISSGTEVYFATRELVNNNVFERANPYVCGLIGGLISAGIFFKVRGLDHDVIRRIQAMCAFSSVYLIGYRGSHWMLKKICGRDRFHDIIAGGDYVFAPWYKPVFFSSGSSFPSGHTGAAMGIMVLLLLPFLFKRFNNHHREIFALSYGFVFLSGLSRLIMGRHFLSDVAASIIIMTIGFVIVSAIFEKIYDKILIK